MFDSKQLKGISPAELLKKLGCNYPPYDPFYIANCLGITIDIVLRAGDRQDLSGYISNRGRGVRIWINPLEPENRQRFTVAHELGHYINDMLGSNKKNTKIEDYVDTLYRDGKKNSMEKKANQFAAELLMPDDDVFEKAKNLLQEYKTDSLPTEFFINKMADIFKVSKLTMLYRLQNLKILKS